tara:strand:+ start:982 stop:2082 length:1101 start_codon:yes stop_codon:yes gene_type:complete
MMASVKVGYYYGSGLINERFVVIGRVVKEGKRGPKKRNIKGSVLKTKKNCEVNLKKALDREVVQISEDFQFAKTKAKEIPKTVISKDLKLKLDKLINPFKNWEKRICIGEISTLISYRPKLVSTQLNVVQQIEIRPTGKIKDDGCPEEEFSITNKVCVKLDNIFKKTDTTTTDTRSYWKNIHAMIIAKLLPDKFSYSIKDANKVAEIDQLMWRSNHALKCYNPKSSMTFLDRKTIGSIINVVKSSRDQKAKYQGVDISGTRYIIEVDKIRSLIDLVDIDTLLNKYTTKLYDSIHFKQNKIDNYLLKTFVRSALWELFATYPDILAELREVGYENIRAYLEMIRKDRGYNFFYMDQYLEVISECLEP